MNYPNGETIEIGDSVTLGGDHHGVVVGIIGEGRYATNYKENDWAYMRNGLIVSTDFGDLRLD
jgi:hypothetical protein